MAETVNPRKRLRGRTVFLYFVVLAAAAVAGWATDAVLLVRLRLIANEAYAMRRDGPVITVDHTAALNKYSPRRLAACLTLASPQMRAVICDSLANRRPPGDAGEWAGVLPALLRAFSQIPDDGDVFNGDRARAWQAIVNVPSIATGDVELVFAFIADRLAANEPHWGLCSHLLSAVFRDQPDQRPRALQVWEQSLAVNPRDRPMTLARLAALAPDSPNAAAAARMASEAPVAFAADRDLLAILERQPALVEEWLVGNEKQRATLLKLAYRSPLGAVTAAPTWLTADRLSRLKTEAAALLNGTDEYSFAAACQFLSQWPEYAALLFETATKKSGKRRNAAFGSADAAAFLRGPEEHERFFAERLPQLLSWLDDEDQFLRQSVLYDLVEKSSFRKDWLKAYRTGADAPIVGACRRLLDKYPGPHDEQCLRVLAEATPRLDPRDIDRVGAALLRSLTVTKQRYEASKVPQDALSPLHQRLFDDIARFHDRPAARQALDLRRTLEAGGVLQPVKRL